MMLQARRTRCVVRFHATDFDLDLLDVMAADGEVWERMVDGEEIEAAPAPSDSPVVQ